MRGIVLAALCGAIACGTGASPARRSHSADAIIEQAATPEERAELERVRDEIDAAARKRIAELDAEIAQLRRENAALRQRTSSKN